MKNGCDGLQRAYVVPVESLLDRSVIQAQQFGLVGSSDFGYYA